MLKKRNQIYSRRIKNLAVLAIVSLCTGFFPNISSGNANIPDNQKAVLTVQGQGVSPNSKISLSTGPSQTIVTKADRSGNFLFSNLKYASFTDLKFSLDIPPYEKGLSQTYPATHLEFMYDARESIASMKGNIGKSGTLAFNLMGSNESEFQVAGNEGFVQLQARTTTSMASGRSGLTASIVNVAEMCCPRLIVPASPILLTISSQPVPNIPSQNQSPVKNVAPIAPKIAPHQTTKPIPFIKKPKQKTPPAENIEKPKKKVPYIIQGRLDAETIVIHDDITSAVSFSAADYDKTYVGGLKKMADETRNSILLSTAAIGSFIDARNLMDTLRALQVSSAKTLVNYTPSNSVCTFGTLSRSLAKTDALSKANHIIFSKILMDRDIQKAHTIYSNAGTGIFSANDNFKKKYCNIKTNGGFLEGYCDSAVATPDLMHDRDVNFTRVFDVPFTLDADFTDNAMTNDKESIIALFDNLSKVQPMMSDDGDAWNPRDNSITTQDFRALAALRTVTSNTFAALVSEKVKSTSQSTQYMKDIVKKLGLDDANATKLIGANPSYFAQMEVLTKKLFQDPSFYASLYDGEANVDRQRVAMKAIELQQERDFLESLRRREMLLSVLLNEKLRTTANRADQDGVIRKN